MILVQPGDVRAVRVLRRPRYARFLEILDGTQNLGGGAGSVFSAMPPKTSAGNHVRTSSAHSNTCGEILAKALSGLTYRRTFG